MNLSSCNQLQTEEQNKLGKLINVCLPLLATASSDPSSHHSLAWDVRLRIPKFLGHQENFQGRWKNNPGLKPGFQVLISPIFGDKHEYKQCIKLI